jgi:hypothetical protein
MIPRFPAIGLLINGLKITLLGKSNVDIFFKQFISILYGSLVKYDLLDILLSKFYEFIFVCQSEKG